MTIRRRSLRKILVAVGCLVGHLVWPWAVLGLALILLGGGLHFLSKAYLTQNRRLTTAGPYRFSRNPFYLANALIDFGLCLVIGHPVVLIVYVLVWAVSYRDTIRREEAHLAELFPDAFARYREAVPVLFPTGRSLPREDAQGEFSLDNDGLARGAEYARLLGIAIAPAAIAAAEWVRRLGLDLLDGTNGWPLALCVSVPALWILKLALAETFRRPETRLMPWGDQPLARGLGFLLLGVAAIVSVRVAPFLMVLPVLWLGVALLDEVGRARSGGRDEGAKPWSYFPAALAGSLTSAFALLVFTGAFA